MCTCNNESMIKEDNNAMPEDNCAPEDVCVKYLSNRHSIVVERLEREKMQFDWLVFMYEGYVTYIIDDVPITIHAGEAMYVPAGSYRQREEQRRSVHYVSLHIVRGGLAPSIARVFKFTERDELVTMLDMLVTSYLSVSRNTSVNNTWLLKLVLSCCEEISCSREFNPKVYQMMNYIMKNIHKKILMSEIAEQVDMTPSYCNTLFKKYSGMTIGDYISRIRLKEAKDELLHTSHSIQRISAQVGFEDELYFSRWFKKHAGVSPEKYRMMFETRK